MLIFWCIRLVKLTQYWLLVESTCLVLRNGGSKRASFNLKYIYVVEITNFSDEDLMKNKPYNLSVDVVSQYHTYAANCANFGRIIFAP
jgi:hypothetical protein